MRHLPYCWTFCASVLLAAACGGAQNGNGPIQGDSDGKTARGETADVWVTSRGEPLPMFYHEGHNYLLGRRGEPYEIWLTNRTDKRLEAVVSVDGRDVISGREADYQQDRGYILYPGEDLQIEGFRTSLDSVARFEFSDIEDSYAARMGDAANVGVIGVALFEEAERPTPAPIAGGAGEPSDDRDYPRPTAQPSAKSAPPPSAGAGAELAMEEAEQGIGTKYGDQVGSEAEIVPFKRHDPDRPTEVIGLYYDDYQGLRARGIDLPDEGRFGAIDPDGPDPFPGTPRDQDYAPPPPPVY